MAQKKYDTVEPITEFGRRMSTMTSPNNAAKSKKVLGKDDIRSFIPFHPLRENKSDGKRLKDSALFGIMLF